MPSSFGSPVKSADRFGALGAGFAVLNGTTSVNLTTQSTYYTVPITVETLDTLSIVTLSANRFTLAAGSYVIVASDIFGISQSNYTAYGAGHTLRLRNITDSTDLFSNTNYNTLAYSGYSSAAPSLGIAAVTITAPKSYELQHVSNNWGIGAPAYITGISASVGQVFIVKVA